MPEKSIKIHWRLIPAALILVTILGLFLLTTQKTPSNPESDERPTARVTAEAIEVMPTVEVEAKPRSNTAPNVGLWKQHEITIKNPTWRDNPFDLEFSALFEHVETGRIVRQLGFYAGQDVWKVFFMPDELGEWRYVTVSPDADLADQSGHFQAVASDLPGRLVPAGNRWRLESSEDYVAPILLPTRQWFKRTSTEEGVEEFIIWADENAGAQVIGTTLVYFGHDQEEVPYIKGREGIEFNIAMWDRLNRHFDRLRDQGMGHYIMFYSDDRESPNRHGIEGRSEEELRLFRYAAARFSAYPIVIWDTGIDIGETRSNEWIDWFAEWFISNDPWGHPVSSRTGGGSRGKTPEAASYYSDGRATLPSHQTVLKAWFSRSIPTIYTDRWREDFSRGGFDRDKIRRAAWEVGLVGGTGVYIGGNENGGYLTSNYASDLQAAPDLRLRTWFFEERIIHFGELVPHPDLVTSGEAVVLAAVPDVEYVAYDADGGPLVLDLTGSDGTFTVSWFDPRSGAFYNGGRVRGGSRVRFEPPTTGDVVLHLIRIGFGPRPILEGGL